MEKKTRFTSKIKTEAVLSLLRGESIEAMARKYGVTIADLNFWRDQFIEQIGTTSNIVYISGGFLGKFGLLLYEGINREIKMK